MNKKYDIIILTDSRYANPSKIDSYMQNVLDEDNYVKHALEKEGLKVDRLAWDDKNFDWNTAKYILFRTTWDYFDRFDEFSQWLDKVSKQTQLLNSEKLIRWNLDKHYLLNLQQNSVSIIPTVYIEKNTQTSLLKLHTQNNWKETILKPCISGGARHTYKLNLTNLEAHENIFQRLIKKEAMMLQPFQNSIVEKGEISLVIINGKFTHAVLKKAKKGDFRVQDDFGGSVHHYTPTTKEITFAEKTIEGCNEVPIYARVDITNDNKGNLVLVELELIEPELWFRNYPKAAKLLAESISNLIKTI